MIFVLQIAAGVFLGLYAFRWLAQRQARAATTEPRALPINRIERVFQAIGYAVWVCIFSLWILSLVLRAVGP